MFSSISRKPFLPANCAIALLQTVANERQYEMNAQNCAFLPAFQIHISKPVSVVLKTQYYYVPWPDYSFFVQRVVGVLSNCQAYLFLVNWAAVTTNIVYGTDQ